MVSIIIIIAITLHMYMYCTACLVEGKGKVISVSYFEKRNTLLGQVFCFGVDII